MERLPQIWQQWRIDPYQVVTPNGERIAQVIKHAIRIFDHITQENTGKLVTIVTHDIIIKVIIYHVLGVAYKILRRFDISNASMTMIRIAESGSRISTRNDVAHLVNPIFDGEKM